MAEPFISPLALTIYIGVSRGCDPHIDRLYTYHTGIVLKVEVDAVGTAPGLALADHNGGHDLLPQLGLTLLDGGHDHVTDTGGGKTVQTSTDTLHRDDVQVTGAGVVAAVEHGAAGRILVSDFQAHFPNCMFSFGSDSRSAG